MTFSGGLCEPFAGGAALFFETRAKPSHLSDINKDLISTYRALQTCPEEVHAVLAEWPIERSTFAEVRNAAPVGDVAIAARFIFLNRTAFGGIWRVNRAGQFNVPFGCKPETRLPSLVELQATSDALAGVLLEHDDFASVSAETSAQTVYFDPPYVTTRPAGAFVRYNEKIFSWTDQLRLAEHAKGLLGDGKCVLVSNAYHSDVRRLYPRDCFKHYRVDRLSRLAARSDARRPVSELLVVSKNVRFRALPTSLTRV